MSRPETTDPENDERCETCCHVMMGLFLPSCSNPASEFHGKAVHLDGYCPAYQSEGALRETAIDRWVGEIQTYLETRIADAPTESCAVLARNLWDETAEFDGDVG